MSLGENKAVFLSYASQDAEAARRICEALRAVGIEVWFDQSELVGGDAWDAKIRGQIASCALFVPMISAATQARREGYFRLEWKLAAQRTHMMSERTPFLLPVVIDATSDKAADVPSEFRAVQWTRLSGGESPLAFCDRVKSLLESGTGIVPMVGNHGQATRAASATATHRLPRRRSRWIAPAMGVVAAIVALAIWSPWKKSVQLAAANAGEKSVAVLPFVNLSGDPAQEYFSDGLTEEILNALARERDLRVPGRASAFSFKGTKATPAEIARALNVTRLVEGSVRRDGKRVRISFQLTRAADGFSEDTGEFTEEVTDVFALQEKVAAAIVAKLTRRTSIAPVSVLTKNPEAYDAYLRGRALQVRAATLSRQTAELYEQAVTLDPRFALAWARLAEARFRSYFGGNDQGPAMVESTREAIEKALEITPDLPEALIIRAHWARLLKSDFSSAQHDLDRAAALQPATGELRFAQAALAQDRGEWTIAFVRLREALALDPENGDQANTIANIFVRRGNLPEADQLYARAIRIQGNAHATPLSNRAWVRLVWRGPEAALRLIEREPTSNSRVEELRAEMLFYTGRVDEARAVATRRTSARQTDNDFSIVGAENWASTLTILGLHELAKMAWDDVRNRAQKQFAEKNYAPRVRRASVRAEIALGQRDAAEAALNEWRNDIERLPSVYRRYSDFWRLALACYAELGKIDNVVAILREIRSHGYLLDYGVRNLASASPSLGDDPRFQMLAAEHEAWAKAQPDPVDL